MFRIAVVLYSYLVYFASVSCEPIGRIVGGNEINITAHPYQVSIRYKSCSTCAFTHRCGGVIYAQRVLITSANCVSGIDAKNLIAVAGSNSITATEGVVSPIQNYVIHENYESLYIDYDISIVILGLELTFTDKLIAPIALAEELPENGTTAYVTGWGSIVEGGDYSEKLRATTVRIVSDAECKSSYGPTRITESMICAGVVAGQADSCKGDSGGPLVVAKHLVGIVSWGRGCGRNGYPGVYANVVALRDWIENTVSNNLKSKT